jgi:hypothetical protein
MSIEELKAQLKAEQVKYEGLLIRLREVVLQMTERDSDRLSSFSLAVMFGSQVPETFREIEVASNHAKADAKALAAIVAEYAQHPE